MEQAAASGSPGRWGLAHGPSRSRHRHRVSASFTGGGSKTAPSTWARLIAKVYEVDPLQCAQCGSPMKVLAVIMDPVEVDKILRHLIKTGRAPPGLDSYREN